VRGHIAKKGRRYYPVVSVGQHEAQRCLKDDCGKRYWVEGGRGYKECPKCGGPLRATEERRQVWQPGHSRKKDAEQALAEALGKLHAGEYVPPSRLTFGQFLTDWLPGVRSDVKASTWESYRINVECHIIPRLGHFGPAGKGRVAIGLTELGVKGSNFSLEAREPHRDGRLRFDLLAGSHHSLGHASRQGWGVAAS
jgi:hypothetical protein